MKRLMFFATVVLALTACNPDTTPVGNETAKGDTVAPQSDTACIVKPPAQPIACTMEWRPVCGCNGVTYSNGCSAEAAGVSHFTEGECDGEKLD